MYSKFAYADPVELFEAWEMMLVSATGVNKLSVKKLQSSSALCSILFHHLFALHVDLQRKQVLEISVISFLLFCFLTVYFVFEGYVRLCHWFHHNY